jgi:hypothetical protein
VYRIRAALARLRSRFCIIDGEAVACDDNGIRTFELVHHHRADERVFLYAFDVIELNGDDLRYDPIEARHGPRWRRSWPRLDPASGSTSTSKPTAKPFSGTRARTIKLLSLPIAPHGVRGD